MEEPSHDEIKAPLLQQGSQPNENYHHPSSPSSSSSSTSRKPQEEIQQEESKEEENSPIKQVAMTVATTDDSTIPVLTFRMWVLGALSCAVLAFLNQFFWYRREPLSITAISAQIAVVPLGQFMASRLPRRVLFKGTCFEFTLNPGPFNVKEHVLITIFANAGAGSVYAIHIVTVVKMYYKKHITFFVSFIVCITTQVLGFGWAGIFRRYLVEPAEMWWPANLVQVSLFRALHEKEERPKGGLSRIQFFLIAFVCSFSYYVFPGYLLQMLISISWLCYAFPTSILANQLGSGLNGLGIAAIGLDWSTISAYLSSPLASPWFATANVAAGFVLIMYVLIPICYWLDVYKAKTFPLVSDDLFTSEGLVYNISAIVDSNFHLNQEAYEKEGRLYLSTFFAITYGVGFAALAATIVHVILFHGREIWEQSTTSFKDKKMDIHTKLMKRYKEVPEWWFWGILVANIAFTIFVCEYYSSQLQLPWWGVLLACAIAFIFTLPIGIITAITNQRPGLNIITEYIIGYIYPGYPVANMCFKVYGLISMKQAIIFLQDFKLGHYMKIPPRTMFISQVSREQFGHLSYVKGGSIAGIQKLKISLVYSEMASVMQIWPFVSPYKQIAGTLIATLVYLSTAWWLLETVDNICTKSSTVWTCPADTVFYDASVIWGLIGPRRIFGDEGVYGAINWFFLGGAVAPVLVWAATKAFPNQHWIRLINMPVLIGATRDMPPAAAINYTAWIVIAFLSGFVAFRYAPGWWKRHNYLLSGALDVGVGFMAVALYLCLEYQGISLSWWGNNTNACDLASCTTAI